MTRQHLVSAKRQPCSITPLEPATTSLRQRRTMENVDEAADSTRFVHWPAAAGGCPARGGVIDDQRPPGSGPTASHRSTDDAAPEQRRPAGRDRAGGARARHRRSPRFGRTCCRRWPSVGRPGRPGPAGQRRHGGGVHPGCRDRHHPWNPGRPRPRLRTRRHRRPDHREQPLPDRVLEQVVHLPRGAAARGRRTAVPGRSRCRAPTRVPARRPERRPPHGAAAARPDLRPGRPRSARTQPAPAQDPRRGDHQPELCASRRRTGHPVQLPQPELPGRGPPGRSSQRPAVRHLPARARLPARRHDRQPDHVHRQRACPGPDRRTRDRLRPPDPRPGTRHLRGGRRRCGQHRRRPGALADRPRQRWPHRGRDPARLASAV